MRVIGVDIGTTTISLVVLDTDSGEVLECVNTSNTAAHPGAQAFERVQDPETIVALVGAQIERLKKRHAPISAIGMDGQMHGVLYVDAQGRAVSPLYTWQDGHGELDAGGETMAQKLSRLTGYPMATGYGLTTHFALAHLGEAPARAEKLCTIADYAAMRLTGRTQPVCHVSNAASMGLFDTARGQWDKAAMARAGLAADILPQTVSSCGIIGEDADGTPIACAIGDNQASFIGAVSEPEHSVLVNVGTGAQVSMMGSACGTLALCEQRPLEGRDRLLVGSSLCGGRAYALLHRFFLDCAKLAGCEADSLYAQMNAAAMTAMDEPSLRVNTRFCGSRSNPQERGSIGNIGDGNLDAAHLAAGVLWGMADELWSFYQEMTAAGARPASVLVASGNGVRRNPALRCALGRRFGMEIRVPVHDEEAAYGAALSAVLARCGREAYARTRRLIRYQDGKCTRDLKSPAEQSFET
ncbi:MAG: sedoheptulokinase [Candidatus Ventricola sp.]